MVKPVPGQLIMLLLIMHWVIHQKVLVNNVTKDFFYEDASFM